MRNDRSMESGSGLEHGALPARRPATARAGVLRNALSVLLSALLVVTMSPLADNASAIARAAEGAPETPTAADPTQSGSLNASENGDNAGGGALS